jgi:hypothetical protein
MRMSSSSVLWIAGHFSSTKLLMPGTLEANEAIAANRCNAEMIAAGRVRVRASAIKPKNNCVIFSVSVKASCPVKGLVWAVPAINWCGRCPTSPRNI